MFATENADIGAQGIGSCVQGSLVHDTLATDILRLAKLPQVCAAGIIYALHNEVEAQNVTKYETGLQPVFVETAILTLTF